MPWDFGLLSMTELRTRPGEILDRVAEGAEAFIIERNGKRTACLVPLSFFFPDISPTRISDEIKELEDHGEVLRTEITETRELVFRFPIKVDDNNNVEIKVVLPHGYPNSCPRVYASQVSEEAPHRWRDGALCLYGVMSSWNPGKHTILSTLGFAKIWLKHYDEWHKTGQWPKQEGPPDGR
jgi:prevent-host-death family protein